MKKCNLLIVCLLMATMLFAQNTQYLPISVVVEEQVEPFPATAHAQLKNKLTQLLTKNGVASMDYLGQFFLTAFVVPQTKDVISSAPKKISETMDMTLYIADYTNKVIFASTSVVIRGVGETETKCYMNALKGMPLTSPDIEKFVREGRDKIIAYYNHEAENIIKKAQFLASTKQYAEALSKRIYAFPYSIGERSGALCNHLIKVGKASLVEEAEDIAAGENIKLGDGGSLNLEPEEEEIFTALDGEKTVDELVEATGKKAYEIMPVLSMLEIKGVCSRGAGNTWTAIKRKK